MRSRDHLDDLAQHRVGANAPGLDDQAAGTVYRGARYVVARDLFDGDRLTRDHRFVDRRATLDDDAVNGHLVAGTDPQAIADFHVLQRDLLLAAVRPDDASGLGGEVQERAERRSRTFTRTQLHHLPEQHEDDNDRACLEIDADVAVLVPESLGKDPGGQYRNDAEKIG